jgi:hypothetical protein
MEVRQATINDLEWVLKEAENFSKFYGSKISLTADKVYAQKFLSNLIEHHVLFVSHKEDGALTGFIAGFMAPHHFNPAIKTLCELLWWVPEEFRGSRAGAMLLNKFIEYGKANCDWITFVLEDNTPISDKALIKRGFRMKEKSYLMEVN